MPHTRTQSRWLLLALLVLTVATLALLWDWNWFRPLVERQASAALGRGVTLQRFDVQLARQPLIVAEGIVIANPDGFPAGSHTGSIGKLAVRIDPWRLRGRELALQEVLVDRPEFDLRPDDKGRPNWEQPTRQDEGGPGLDLWIGRLELRNGNVHVLEPRLKADFELAFRTEPAPDGEPRLHVDAKGAYAGAPISARFIGGSLLGLRQPERPYPVDLRATNGATEITLKGTLLQPLKLGGAKLDLRLKGDSLEALYPLTGVPLPPTAAYQLQGKLDYEQGRVRFREFSGTVGESDLSGELAVDLNRKRRLVTANLLSQKVVLADLGGFVGATPGKAGAPSETETQKQQRAKADQREHVLPDSPINLPKLRAADLDIHYRGAHIESEMPLDEVSAHLIVKEGLLSLKPLSFKIGKGRIAGNIELDGRSEVVHLVSDIDFRRIDLRRLMRDNTRLDGVGLIGGTARLDSYGNSTAQVLGSGDGELKVYMSRGELSALLVNLAGLEFGKALLSAIGLPSQTQVRCMVGDFELKEGLLGTRMMLVDTGEANVIGDGSINLRDETLDYRIHTKPKRFGVGSMRAPIEIGGTFKDPKIRPDWERLAARGGVALALGVFLTPLAALLPTVELGLGEDNDCKALVEEIKAEAANLPKETGKAPKK